MALLLKGFFICPAHDDMTDQEYLTLHVWEIDWESLPHEEIDRILQLRVDEYERHIAERGGKRPKREGYVIERLALMSNLRHADSEAQAGKLKENRGIRRHNLRAERDLRLLQMMILTLTFPPVRYTIMFRKTDAGKVREIAKQSYFPWRILHHDIMLVIGSRLYGSLIMDTFACIKGKGLHFGVKRVKKFIRLHPEYRWFWKTDFKRYYQSLPHDVIRAGLERKIKDVMFIELVNITLFSYESSEEISNLLEEEALRKERCADWCLYKPTSRQFRTYHDRPLYEGGIGFERLLSLQRRYHRLRKDQRRSSTPNERIYFSDGSFDRTCGKSESRTLSTCKRT